MPTIKGNCLVLPALLPGQIPAKPSKSNVFNNHHRLLVILKCLSLPGSFHFTIMGSCCYKYDLLMCHQTRERGIRFETNSGLDNYQDYRVERSISLLVVVFIGVTGIIELLIIPQGEIHDKFLAHPCPT